MPLKFFALLLFVFSPSLYADDKLIGTGHVANSPINIDLKILDQGGISGSYAYKKTNIPIYLSGTLEGDSIFLETSGDQNLQESFTGTVTQENGKITKISGTWNGQHTNHGAKSNGYPFQVTLIEHPLVDRNVTCQEMQQYPEIVFELDDLGSGHGSPYHVDFSCPKSLGQLSFMGGLIQRATEIRGHNGSRPSYCTGSIIHAQWRYFQFDLARLGYLPADDLRRIHTDGAMEYFREWSTHGLYNKHQYEAYIAEQERVKPLLVDWYQSDLGATKETAQRYSDKALSVIATWGFGSSGSWKPKPLVPFTTDVLDGNMDNFLAALPDATHEQKLNSLNRILPLNPDPVVIQQVLASLGSPKFDNRSESPLSFAVEDNRLLSLLLDSGFSPNHQNTFGKTPLFYAIQFNNLEGARILLSHGADVNHRYQEEKENKWSCSGIRQWGRTPLMHAAQHADINVIKLLLENGANSAQTDVLGNSALDYARNNGKEQNATFLTKVIGIKGDIEE